MIGQQAVVFRRKWDRYGLLDGVKDVCDCFSSFLQNERQLWNREKKEAGTPPPTCCGWVPVCAFCKMVPSFPARFPFPSEYTLRTAVRAGIRHICKMQLCAGETIADLQSLKTKKGPKRSVAVDRPFRVNSFADASKEMRWRAEATAFNSNCGLVFVESNKGVKQMDENEYLPGSIRDRIVDLKRTRNVTNKTISEKTAISESLLSRIESGKQQTVNDETILKLASFFGVSTDFLLGRTNVPDKKNYTIAELGLSAQAARCLHTGSVNVTVLNRLLAEPEFATLTQMIADYFGDTYAMAIATQNQIHQSTAELFSRIAREDKQRRQKAASLAKQARAQCAPLYKTELAQLAVQFEKTLRAVKKDLPKKAEAAKAMTKEAFDHMLAELSKNGSATDVLTVRPEEIAVSICEYVNLMDGVTQEMKDTLYQAVLPLFRAGGKPSGRVDQ